MVFIRLSKFRDWKKLKIFSETIPNSQYRSSQMNCCLDLFHLNNPHGFCGPDSCLFCMCTIPLGVITLPLWAPIMIVWVSYQEISKTADKNIEWSESHRMGYERVDLTK